MDLNRNYGVDWGVSDQTQIGLGDLMYDQCADPCGECYRGKEPFSEPETRAVRDFLLSHKNEIKFVANFHSYGNMWIYPYNGKKINPIKTKNPDAFLIFSEIIEQATFPENMKNDGNSQDILGERIGGDMDDWVLSELNIPSVTNELGTINQYNDEWSVRSKEDAKKICDDNSQWLDFVYEKLGVQMSIEPLYYERKGDKVTLTMQVSNLGLSNMNDVVQAGPAVTAGDNLAQQDVGVHRFQPALVIKSTDKVSLSQTDTESWKNNLAQVSLVDQPASVSVNDQKLSLAARDTKTIQMTANFNSELIQRSIHEADEGPLQGGLRMNFKYSQFASSIVPGQEPSDVLLSFKEKSQVTN